MKQPRVAVVALQRGDFFCFPINSMTDVFWVDWFTPEHQNKTTWMVSAHTTGRIIMHFLKASVIYWALTFTKCYTSLKSCGFSFFFVITKIYEKLCFQGIIYRQTQCTSFQVQKVTRKVRAAKTLPTFIKMLQNR